MPIEINIKIDEQPDDGPINVSTKSLSIGTTKEMAHAVVIIQAVETACKMLVEATGGHQETLRKTQIIKPLGRG